MARVPTLAISTLNDLAADGVGEFSTRQVAEYAGLSPKSASALLSRLVRMGLVDRVARGRFALREVGMLGTTAASEDLALAIQAALGERQGRIAFRSALSDLGLLSHPARTIHVASPHRVRLRALSGRPVVFHHERSASLRLGADRLRESVWRSTPARALLESAQHPRFAGGVAAVAEALMAAHVEPEALADLAARIDSAAGLRRLGSLSDHLGGSLARRLDPPPKARTIPLDPAERADAAAPGAWRDTRWGVEWPMPAVELLRAIG